MWCITTLVFFIKWHMPLCKKLKCCKKAFKGLHYVRKNAILHILTKKYWAVQEGVINLMHAPNKDLWHINEGEIKKFIRIFGEIRGYIPRIYFIYAWESPWNICDLDLRCSYFFEAPFNLNSLITICQGAFLGKHIIYCSANKL